MTATEFSRLGAFNRVQRQIRAGLEHFGHMGLFEEPDLVAIAAVEVRVP